MSDKVGTCSLLQCSEPLYWFRIRQSDRQNSVKVKVFVRDTHPPTLGRERDRLHFNPTEGIHQLDSESHPPTNFSTRCLLLLIKILSRRFYGGVEFLKLINKYILWDKLGKQTLCARAREPERASLFLWTLIPGFRLKGVYKGLRFRVWGVGSGTCGCGRTAGCVSGVVQGGQFQVSGIQKDSVQARRARNTLHGEGSNSMSTLEATQGQIVSQSPTDATSSR